MAYSVLPTVNAGDILASVTWGNIVKADIEFLFSGKATDGSNNESLSVSTTSATFVLADASLAETIIVTTGRVLVIASGNFGSGAANTATLDLFVDGVDTDFVASQVNNAYNRFFYLTIQTVSAGAHTFDLRFKSSTASGATLAGTGTGGGATSPIVFRVIEL